MVRTGASIRTSQQFNKDFLRDNFKTTAGARWKVPGSPQGRGGLEYLGEDPAVYKRIYEIKTADDKKSWSAFIDSAAHAQRDAA